MTSESIVTNEQAQSINATAATDPSVKQEIMDLAKTIGLNLSGPKAYAKLETLYKQAMIKQKQLDDEAAQAAMTPDSWNNILWASAQALNGQLL